MVGASSPKTPPLRRKAKRQRRLRRFWGATAGRSGRPIALNKLEALHRKTKPPARYTQASLIKQLEKDGIGRPSTYAAIMKTIIDRGYVEEKARKLFATDLGMVVSDWLKQQYQGNFIDIDFTARMENQLDEIARGEQNWEQCITKACFSVRDHALKAGLHYDPLSQDGPPPVDNTISTDVEPCPLCQKGMVKRQSRYGVFYACSEKSCPGIRGANGKPNAKTLKLMNGEPEAEQTETGTDKPKRKRSAKKKAPASKKNTAKKSTAKKAASSKKKTTKAAASGQSPACPLCGASMMQTTDQNQQTIWSCSRFPSCLGTLPVT